MNIECTTDLVVFSLTPYHSENCRTSKVVRDLSSKRRVYFIESPISGVSTFPTYFLQKNDEGVTVVKPYLPGDTSVFEQKAMLLQIINSLIEDENISHYSVWSDTPKAVPFIRELKAEFVVYDCLHDYSQTHHELEREMLNRSDVVLTSGLSEKIPEPMSHYFALGNTQNLGPKLWA
jgi:hypothetical protein